MPPIWRLLPQLGVRPRSLLNLCTLFLAPFRFSLVGCHNSSFLEFPKASVSPHLSLQGEDAPVRSSDTRWLKVQAWLCKAAARDVHSLLLVGSFIQTSG